MCDRDEVRRQRIAEGMMIAVYWDANDIQDYAECEYDETLTDDELREILSGLKRRHDCEMGINWDVISYWIEDAIATRLRNKVQHGDN